MCFAGVSLCAVVRGRPGCLRPQRRQLWCWHSLSFLERPQGAATRTCRWGPLQTLPGHRDGPGHCAVPHSLQHVLRLKRPLQSLTVGLTVVPTARVGMDKPGRPPGPRCQRGKDPVLLAAGFGGRDGGWEGWGRDGAPRALALLKPAPESSTSCCRSREVTMRKHTSLNNQNRELSWAAVLFEGTGRWSGRLHSPPWVEVPVFC